MRQTLLTVIIPIYNAEKTLSYTINSLLNSRCDDIEIILVNDGSRDNTVNICDRYLSKFDFFSVVNKPNGGVSSARNAGLDIARGEYVWFVDADDFIYPNSIDVILDCISNNTCELISFAYSISNKSTPIYYSKKPWSGVVSLNDYLLAKPTGYIWNHIYKRSYIEDFNLRFDTSLISTEDFLFHIQYMTKIDNVRIIPNVLYSYENNPSSCTRLLTESKLINLQESSMCCLKSVYKLASFSNMSSVMNSVNFMTAAMLFSLYSNKYSLEYVSRQINVLIGLGLYPIRNTNSIKANIAIGVFNIRPLFMFLIKIKRLLS